MAVAEEVKDIVVKVVSLLFVEHEMGLSRSGVECSEEKGYSLILNHLSQPGNRTDLSWGKRLLSVRDISVSLGSRLQPTERVELKF